MVGAGKLNFPIDEFTRDSFLYQLLLKIQTKRNGCNYGDPQYLRVRLTNCESAIVNPVIKSGTNY